LGSSISKIRTWHFFLNSWINSTIKGISSGLIWNFYYANGDIPHASKDKGSFWWRNILKLCDEFRAIAKCNMGNGTTMLF
jgi:hypothetical protein